MKIEILAATDNDKTPAIIYAKGHHDPGQFLRQAYQWLKDHDLEIHTALVSICHHYVRQEPNRDGSRTIAFYEERPEGNAGKGMTPATVLDLKGVWIPKDQQQ